MGKVKPQSDPGVSKVETINIEFWPALRGEERTAAADAVIEVLGLRDLAEWSGSGTTMQDGGPVSSDVTYEVYPEAGSVRGVLLRHKYENAELPSLSAKIQRVLDAQIQRLRIQAYGTAAESVAVLVYERASDGSWRSIYSFWS